jgi:hydrogenase maturation factor
MRVLHPLADALVLCAGEGGARAEVMTDLVSGAQAGDLLLVHAGVALARVREDEAPA